MSSTPSNSMSQPFSEYLESFKNKLHQLFHQRTDLDELSTKRGMPPFVLREIMSCNPLATYIPTEYGGRGGHIHEGLAITAAASYESLPLSLGFGINWALFLQPVIKYAREEAKIPVLDEFIQHRKMGGLMITEPDHGSDALHMKTSYIDDGENFHLKGTKHWAGLTGWADYWLLTARKTTTAGELSRDIDFFICDVAAPKQHVHVEEFYENLGIYLLPYGRNHIDVHIPKVQKLVPHSSGIKMMLDLLHRSRMQFPGMAMGFLQRILDEAVAHCRQRSVGGRSLFLFDQVQQRISNIQGAVTIASAMCLNSSQKADITNDLSTAGLEVNCIKTYITDLMQNCSQSLLQLVGAKGYRLNHIAGRAIVDSRPFQIFEGSNDILYIQIGEAILKRMKKLKQSNLLQTFKLLDLTSQAADRLKRILDISVPTTLPQRKLHDLGVIASRIVAMEMLIKLALTPYSNKLIDSAIEMVSQEVHTLTSGFLSSVTNIYVQEDSNENSWLACYYHLQR